jgi:hypothetical protein
MTFARRTVRLRWFGQTEPLKVARREAFFDARSAHADERAVEVALPDCR